MIGVCARVTQTTQKQTFFGELKRRNVVRVGIAYVVVAWLVLQVADVVLNNIAAPQWLFQVILLLLAIGFPLALVFAWAFELTPEGVKRESEVDRGQSITAQTGRKLDFAIIAVLAVALGWFAWDKFIRAPAETRPAGTAAVSKPKDAASGVPQKSVAVLPFVVLSSGPDDEYFADGLTEEILNALAQLPELLVTSRTSAFHFKGQQIPVQQIAAALGVRHVVEGSVRKSGDRLRVTAQLIRAADGFHLWSENYDGASDDAIAVQEDIAAQIATAMDVVLDDDKRELMVRVGLRDVEAFIEFQKGQEYYARAHSVVGMDRIGDLTQANRHYEAVLVRVPDYAPAHEMHSDLYVHIAIDDAADESLPGVSAEDIAAAPARAVRDFAAAVEHARSPEARRNAEFDLAFVSGNWRGLRGRIDLIVADRGCDEPLWIQPVAEVYRIANRYLSRAKEIRTCDPLVSLSWWNEADLMLWSGDVAGAVALTRRGLEVAVGGSLNEILISALTATGQFDLAEREITDRIHAASDAKRLRTMVAAARGERDAAAMLADDYLSQSDTSGFWALQVNAWLGGREAANRLAGKIDAHPFGSQTLVLVVGWCGCGAPFDLEATPNFAAKLEEAGMPWPPASPIRFPLKTW